MGRLVVNDLQMHYRTRKGNVRAVDKITFTLEPGAPWASWGNRAAASPASA